MSTRIDAELATLADAAPAGNSWLHEIKFDGYRILARIEADQVRLISRNHLDWTPRFRWIAEAVASIADQAILDGEIVALDQRGASSFGALQQALSSGRSVDLVYMIFDLLYLNGYDLRPLPARGPQGAPRPGARRSSAARPLQRPRHRLWR
jgi:bifunctional non-homologous end joining protein LigD